MNSIKRLILGVTTAPAVVAAARGCLFYLLPLGGGALIAYLSALSDPRWLWMVALIPLIRALEGALIDQVWKSGQNQTNPPSPAGETPPAAVPPTP